MCDGATGSLKIHSSCVFVLEGASLDPSEFIVARTSDDIWLTFAVYNSLRYSIFSSLRVICSSSGFFFHSSCSRAIALCSSNLACNSCQFFSILSKVSVVSEVWISISLILTFFGGAAAVGESAECDGPTT